MTTQNPVAKLLTQTDAEDLKSWLGCDKAEIDAVGVWVESSRGGHFLAGPALAAFRAWQAQRELT